MVARKDFTAYSSLGLATVSASLVLFPSVFSLAKPPLIQNWLMWVYLSLAFAAFIVLCAIYYITTFTRDPLPHRLSGIGSIFTVGCLASFVGFLFLNIWQDQAARPQILSLMSNSYKVEPGDIVAFSGEGSNESGDNVTWRWCVTAKAESSVSKQTCLPSAIKTATWYVPEAAQPGIYAITATVSNSGHSSTTESMEIKVWKKK